MHLANVARERHRLEQERQTLEKRLRSIAERIVAITADETRLKPLIRLEGDHAATPRPPASAPAPAPETPRAPLLPAGFSEMTLQY